MESDCHPLTRSESTGLVVSPLKEHTVRDTFVRGGFIVCGCGTVVTLLGTILVARGGNNLEPVGTVIQAIGKGMMLVSLVIVIIGYRLKQIAKRTFLIQQSLAKRSSQTSTLIRRNGQGGTMYNTMVSRFAMLFTLLAIVQCAFLASPPPVLMFGTHIIQTATMVFCLLAVCHDRGNLRAFCLGVIASRWNSGSSISMVALGMFPFNGNYLGGQVSGLVTAIFLGWMEMLAAGGLAILGQMILFQLQNSVAELRDDETHK